MSWGVESQTGDFCLRFLVGPGLCWGWAGGEGREEGRKRVFLVYVSFLGGWFGLGRPGVGQTVMEVCRKWVRRNRSKSLKTMSNYLPY